MTAGNRCGLHVWDLLLCLGLQSAKKYYEQALMQELKKNQELQEYIRLLEDRMHHPDKECTPDKQVLYLSPICTPDQLILLHFCQYSMILSIIHQFFLCLHSRVAPVLWYAALFRASPIILQEDPICHPVTLLDTTPHPAFPQLLPAQRQGSKEKTRAAVPNWEPWEAPGKKCRI